MTVTAFFVSAFVGLFALALLAGGVLAWVSSIQVEQLTSTHSTLAHTADGTLKVALGAIVGFAGGAGLARRNGGTER